MKIKENSIVNELNFHIRQGISKKDLTDLINERIKQLTTPDVNQQRELLIDCANHCYNVDNYKFRTTEDKVDNYLESINCG